MDQHDLIDRLRTIGGHPVDETVAAGHLERATAAALAGPRRWTTIAAACLLLIGLPAVGIAAARAGGGGGDPIAVGQPSNEPRPLSCIGPPPFAARPAAGVSDRALEAAAFVAWRQAHCRDDGTTTTTTTTTTSTITSGPTITDKTSTTTGASTSSVPVEGCSGPPPFAGTRATPADPQVEIAPSLRADEAAAHAELRAQCPHEDEATTSSPATTTAGTEPPSIATPGDDHGPPYNVPGPLENAPGPPEGVPGPPNDVAGATASGGQEGPPQGVPAGGGGVANGNSNGNGGNGGGGNGGGHAG